MSGSNSHKAAREKMAKTKSKENKRKRQMKHRIAKRPRLRTDINQRVLTNPFRRLSTEKEMSISMVGLDGAGKTTILYKLGEDMVEKTSAEGLHLETLVYDNITLNAWDVSGARKTRLQGIHFKDTKGLIFVVDSTARDKQDRARRELHMLLNEDSLKDVVLLVFANKHDVPKRMNEAEITEMLGLSSPIPQRHCRVQITCATSGEGLYEGLDWLSKKIKPTCATSRDGVSEGLNWLRNSSANKSNMKIFKVSESADSASIANKVRDVQEAYNRWLAQGEKVKLLEAAMREEKMKEDSCTRKLGVQVQRLIKKVKKYDRDENRKRASTERIARNYLKYRSKHTRD